MTGNVNTVLNQLADKLQTALSSDLVSVVLYGSAASGDHQKGFSDYNVLCILTQITPVQLGAAEPVFRWWREQGNPSPLLLTEHELQTSSDCFPIEFHDIRENHQILFGPNLVADLEIGTSFYRAQVEHELRAKLLRLRQKASGILSDKDVLRRLLADSISTFCVLFRHALILHGKTPPALKRDVIRDAVALFGIDPAPFNTLLDCREEKIEPKAFEPQPLLAQFMTDIARVIDAVDIAANTIDKEEK